MKSDGMGISIMAAWEAWLATRLERLGSLRLRVFVQDVLRLSGIIVLLVEAVFLSERFPMVFRDVLRSHASLFDTALIFFLTIPQIFDLALPLAMLIGTYVTVLQLRESRELLVLCSAGMGPMRLIQPVLFVAVLATLASLLVSGLVNPMAVYAQRDVLFDAEYRALTQRNNWTGQFYFFNDRVVFAPGRNALGGPKLVGREKHDVFMYEPVDPAHFRVVLTGQADVATKHVGGYVPLRLKDVQSRTFRFTPLPSDETVDDRADEMLLATAADQGVDMNDLLPFPARGENGAELTSAELTWRRTGDGLPSAATQTRLLGERVGRGLLCLVAPLLAIAAMCLTSRRTLYLSLPVGCIILMSLNISTEWVIREIGALHPLLLLVVLTALTAWALVVLVYLIGRGQQALFRPQLARA